MPGESLNQPRLQSNFFKKIILCWKDALESSLSLKMNAYWSNNKISSYFSSWKLDCFFDMAILKTIFDTRKILNDKPFLSFFLNPANHIEFFSVILKSDMEPGCIFLNINPISIKKNTNQSLPSISVSCNWESLCTKIVAARLYASGLRLKHGNIISIKTTYSTQILWVVLSWICNMYVPWHHYGRHFCA